MWYVRDKHDENAGWTLIAATTPDRAAEKFLRIQEPIPTGQYRIEVLGRNQSSEKLMEFEVTIELSVYVRKIGGSNEQT